MDPKTRRSLWNCLNSIRNRGKALILTTHRFILIIFFGLKKRQLKLNIIIKSMDETEALCTNIGIMVNGELKCLGSLQHLKSRYGEGYTLMVKLALNQDGEDKKIIDNFITYALQTFDNSEVKESRDGFINFHINDNSTSILSKVFATIENVKQKYSIEYYIVTQTKLEQIFLNFASKQIDPESRNIPTKSLMKKIACC
jgi:ABC-type multidrug transport system ATPase subunit